MRPKYIVYTWWIFWSKLANLLTLFIELVRKIFRLRLSDYCLDLHFSISKVFHFRTMAQLDYAALSKVFEDIVLGTSYDIETSRNIFLEVLPHVRTTACALFIKYLVVEQTVNNDQYEYIVISRWGFDLLRLHTYFIAIYVFSHCQNFKFYLCSKIFMRRNIFSC